MKQTLFKIDCQNKMTGERIAVFSWGQDADSVTRALVDGLFGRDGNYHWLGSGPAYDENGVLIQREIGG